MGHKAGVKNKQGTSVSAMRQPAILRQFVELIPPHLTAKQERKFPNRAIPKNGLLKIPIREGCDNRRAS